MLVLRGLIWKEMSAISSAVTAQKSKAMRVSAIKKQWEQYCEGIHERLSTGETDNSKISELNDKNVENSKSNKYGSKTYV